VPELLLGDEGSGPVQPVEDDVGAPDSGLLVEITVPEQHHRDHEDECRDADERAVHAHRVHEVCALLRPGVQFPRNSLLALDDHERALTGADNHIPLRHLGSRRAFHELRGPEGGVAYDRGDEGDSYEGEAGDGVFVVEGDGEDGPCEDAGEDA
ncbi:hypothetical protein V490_05284, partial [Pseudogymnoascus sp. VKM F-3557]